MCDVCVLQLNQATHASATAGAHGSIILANQLTGADHLPCISSALLPFRSSPPFSCQAYASLLSDSLHLELLTPPFQGAPRPAGSPHCFTGTQTRHAFPALQQTRPKHLRDESSNTFGRLRPYRHIIAALRTIASGLAMSCPAMSGAEPCTWAHVQTKCEKQHVNFAILYKTPGSGVSGL